MNEPLRIEHLKPDSVYRLPNGELLKYAQGTDKEFMLRKGKDGSWDTLCYLVAYGWLYHLARTNGVLEWKASDWTCFDLEEVDGNS